MRSANGANLDGGFGLDKVCPLYNGNLEDGLGGGIDTASLAIRSPRVVRRRARRGVRRLVESTASRLSSDRPGAAGR
jgi:hypothetical protein